MKISFERGKKNKEENRKKDVHGGPIVILIFTMLVQNENMDLCEGQKFVYALEMEHTLHVEKCIKMIKSNMLLAVSFMRRTLKSKP